MIPEDASSRGEPPTLKVAFIVTEYPKTTETFIMRDVMDFSENGCEMLIFSLTHFNKRDVLHDFAKPTQAWARDYAYFASVDVLAATGYFLWHRPAALGRIVLDIVRGTAREPVMLLKSLFILPKSLRIAREVLRWKADHVHAAYAGHPTTAAWVIRRVTGIPFSLSSHAHDLFETQALLATKLPEAKLVRTISHFNRRFILTHVPCLADRPPEVIHVGTYLKDDGQRMPLSQINGFRALYVGSLEQRKGVDLLLKAFARVRQPDWHLDIIGNGPERAGLESLAQLLGLSDAVVFHGARPNEAVGLAMRQASLLVVPSRIGARNQTEGLPTVIVEAFAARLPVVATRLTGIPEIVRHEETGLLFEMEDEAGLADALTRMAADPDRAAAWADAGRALVEAEFDQKKNARQLLDRIRSTLPGTRQAAL
jgi:colanic acid/amylovoran biosynthesis glycosyltransferase